MLRRIVYTLGVVGLFFLLSTTTYSQNDCSPAAGEPITIGVVFPAGNLFSPRFGEPLRGAQAMIEAVNACGGVNGHPVEWLYAEANNRTEAQAALQTLIEQQVSIVIGSGSPAVSEMISEIAEREEIVFWEVSEALIGNQIGREWTFSPRPTHLQMGESAADYILTSLQAGLKLDTLKAALIYEGRLPAQQIARGIKKGLGISLVLEKQYDNVLQDTYALAEQIRDQGVNVVIIASFDDDADSLWFRMREADANVAAWIHIGNEGYREGMCGRIGNSEDFISIGASGPVSDSYREQIAGAIYTQYIKVYRAAHTNPPTERADLAASGVYTLLSQIMPQISGTFTAENVRSAIQTVQSENVNTGLMGYGYANAANLNQFASVVALQRQNGQLCAIGPDHIATCSEPVQPFMTWRARALLQEQKGCGENARQGF